MEIICRRVPVLGGPKYGQKYVYSLYLCLKNLTVIQMCAILLLYWNQHNEILRKYPMLLEPQWGYLLGSSRSIGFSWDHITLISVKKQTCTCFSKATSRKCTRLYVKFVKKTLTDRKIVPIWQFLVPLWLEPVCINIEWNGKLCCGNHV